MRTNPDGEIAPINGPQSNLFIIASQKVKAISAGYAPICNFCGNVCDNNQWFNKKTNKRLESGSIHDVLKKVTSCYILCKDVLIWEISQKFSVQTILRKAPFNLC